MDRFSIYELFSCALKHFSLFTPRSTRPSDKVSYFKTNLVAVDKMMVYYTDTTALKIFKCVYSHTEPNYLLLILNRILEKLINRIRFLKWLLLQTAAV